MIPHLAERVRKKQSLKNYSDKIITKEIARLQTTLPIAESLNIPNLAIETRYLLTLLEVNRCLNQLSDKLVKSTDLQLENPKTRQYIESLFNEFKTAVDKHLTAYHKRLELWKTKSKADTNLLQQRNDKQWEKITESIHKALEEVLNYKN